MYLYIIYIFTLYRFIYIYIVYIYICIHYVYIYINLHCIYTFYIHYICVYIYIYILYNIHIDYIYMYTLSCVVRIYCKKIILESRVFCISLTSQVPCTEIIDSAVADVADMAELAGGDPNKKCAVLSRLSRVPHNKSETYLKSHASIKINILV